ncbi:MAG: M48 family metallopeptidase [Candidatus Niyogibacteria bacterium]|nr:M48 family metallopeptidase [Candidatus Niyogibacteria bacterium]
MSLYTHQESNIRKTWLLFTVFFIVVIGIGWTFSYIYGNQAILIFAVLFSVIMSFASYWYSDKIVLSLARAVPVTKKERPELYNIVENLSITAGLPMPRVYLIDEDVPNAFATGRNPGKAVVAVTDGLLRILDRSELEGVLAHELSHVGNRDMLLSTMAVVLVGFVALLSDMFLRSLFWGSVGGGRDRRGGGGIVMLIGIALAILSPLIAILMQLAISRKREYLADASGALLTRYPEGLASALEKIGRYARPMKTANNATAHLWFSDPHGKKHGGISKLFMTHPPIEDRIARLRGMDI